MTRASLTLVKIIAHRALLARTQASRDTLPVISAEWEANRRAALTLACASGSCSNTGSIRVPVSVSPERGTVSSRYRVTWATDPPTGAHAFQVQIRPPGATKFVDWIAASPEGFAVFDASSPMWSGRGQYAFRVRYVQTTTGAASGFSGVRLIDVT